MPNLIMLVGNIGSGKSTVTKDLVKNGYVVISRDALRYMVGGGSYVFDVDLEPEIFKIERYALQVMSDIGNDIVIDETNVSTFIRSRHFAVIKDKGYTVTAVVMPRLSKAESVKRRMQSNHGDADASVWGDVWDRFNKVYVEPSKKEGFTKIVKYTEGSNETLRNL
jgi:predicted kinase